MDRQEFVASDIKSLAWPTAFVIAIVVLRKAIRDVAQRIVELRWGDKVATLQAAEQEIQELGQPTFTSDDLHQIVRQAIDATASKASKVFG